MSVDALLAAAFAADPKTTRVYHRSRNQLNRDATYAIAQHPGGDS